MWLLYHPADFPRLTDDDDGESPDGSAWELSGFTFETNPRMHLEGWEDAVLEIWQASRIAGVFGVSSSPVYPDAGGLFDQSAKTMDALVHCDRIAADCKAYGDKKKAKDEEAAA